MKRILYIIVEEDASDPDVIELVQAAYHLGSRHYSTNWGHRISDWNGSVLHRIGRDAFSVVDSIIGQFLHKLPNWPAYGCGKWWIFLRHMEQEDILFEKIRHLLEYRPSHREGAIIDRLGIDTGIL